MPYITPEAVRVIHCFVEIPGDNSRSIADFADAAPEIYLKQKMILWRTVYSKEKE